MVVAICAILWTAAAAATPPPPPPDHNIDKAHCRVVALVAELNRRDSSTPDRIKIVSDETGVVRPATRDRFDDELFGAGGPVDLIDWGLVRQAQARAIYAITLGNDKVVAGYVAATKAPVSIYRHQTRWLVSFYSDHIVDMHRAEDLELLAEEAKKTPDCASDPGASNQSPHAVPQ